MTVRPAATTEVRAWDVNGGPPGTTADVVATEEPLEIRVVVGSHTKPVAVTMRTPGADFELAAGFLFGEGVIKNREAIRSISYCLDRDIDVGQRYNIVNVDLNSGVEVDLAPLERHFSITSACGVCGKASLDSLRQRGLDSVRSDLTVKQEVLSGLDAQLRAAQALFQSTGGLHASGLFDSRGDLLALREDVGRHNALDKLVGWALLSGQIPLADSILLVSGRASYELVQKALSAGVPMLCSVSAPSSLAVDLATSFGITLVGFLRGDRFKIYAHPNRVELTGGQHLLT